ncbi:MULTISPECIES: 50S ribosomal protein L25/general stress protein Ctc [Actinoalloteichus]|uniref:Large ribosomal subunit protein bL25 n=1 Tax=Actinoalloteichus fjordicus TaxID=1612552 RepID=A0AAC9LAG2_9PSEU|nr:MULTISPECIES: 50S ribosomal protein L25/general stress protein Ctc [Actinoalloteichus]APU12805.1 ribosomal protein L25, Ctc-form [Actinoalloteichus fjordicus]APU18777.1 ribosomal protein L25, Ctc-form [Actinoalloteichus sp. GBA129-24]
MSQVRLAAETRTEFGKGAARRTRRAGKIPAVLYGHGSDPKHLSLPALEFARVVREHGRNAVLSLDFAGGTPELALTKTVTVHPLKNYIEHVDLLLVQRGEKVSIEVPVIVNGDAGPGTLVNQDVTVIEVAADALNIPEQFEVSVEGATEGTHVLASQVALPAGVELVTDPETLIVSVNAAPTAAQMDAEAPEAAEGAEENGEASES